MFECDLHTHTLRSDGHVSPVESIDRAAQAGIKVMAITDHDTALSLYYEVNKERDGNTESDLKTEATDAEKCSNAAKMIVNLEKYAAEKGVELIRGIEVSCDTDNEDVHIIGLFCDWENPWFTEIEKFVQDSRTGAYKEMVKRIKEDGYDISWDEMLEKKGISDEPEKVCKKHFFEYFAEKGYVDTWPDAKKWVQSIPRYSVKREKPDPIKTIQKLHETGGIVILAHPFLIAEETVYQGKTMSRFEYIDMLVDAGLDGIEGCYAYDKTSYRGSLSKNEIEQMVRERYEKKGLFISGGSDFHGDYKTGMKNPRELGECGVSYEYYCNHIKKKSG